MQYFDADDVYLISFILLKQPEVESKTHFKVEAGRTVAKLPADNSTFELIRQYSAGESVPANEFSRMIKRIRGQFITKRNETKGDFINGNYK